MLVREGVLAAEQLRQALTTQGLMSGRMDTVLLDLGVMREGPMLEALGRYHNTRTVSNAQLQSVEPEILRTISPRMAKRFEIVPFRLVGKNLSVASLNPGDLVIEDELGLMTGYMITSFVGLEVRVYQALAQYYGVDLTPQMTSVARRFAGDGATTHSSQSGWENNLESAPEPIRPPRPGPGSSADATHPSPQATPEHQRNLALPELEIADDDLEQFPSLRQALSHSPPEPQAETTAVTGADTKTESATPDDRLRQAAVALQNAEMREDIADTLLRYCEPYFRRRMLLTLHKESVIGWRADGENVEGDAVRLLSIPASEPSVFNGLIQGTSYWLGQLPAMPHNLELMAAIGSSKPCECIILPVTLRTKTVCFLYGDNLDDGVGAAPIQQLRRLVAKAGLAFQVYLLKNKIRTL